MCCLVLDVTPIPRDRSGLGSWTWSGKLVFSLAGLPARHVA